MVEVKMDNEINNRRINIRNEQHYLELMNDLAIKYFGMPPGVGLTQFAADIDTQFSRTVLATFNTNDLIQDNNIPTKDNTLNNEEGDWEDLLTP